MYFQKSRKLRLFCTIRRFAGAVNFVRHQCSCKYFNIFLSFQDVNVSNGNYREVSIFYMIKNYHKKLKKVIGDILHVIVASFGCAKQCCTLALMLIHYHF